ncbi:unnamed protein product [Linum trigynum]|uniref:Secreted protein n=1 Tax=Linum trigynum TaxID=586398 RepID=A0AAV2CZT5_9ROSI
MVWPKVVPLLMLLSRTTADSAAATTRGLKGATTVIATITSTTTRLVRVEVVGTELRRECSFRSASYSTRESRNSLMEIVVPLARTVVEK